MSLQRMPTPFPFDVTIAGNPSYAIRNEMTMNTFVKPTYQ